MPNPIAKVASLVRATGMQPPIPAEGSIERRKEENRAADGKKPSTANAQAGQQVAMIVIGVRGADTDEQ
jgi:hypothetical protein